MEVNIVGFCSVLATIFLMGVAFVFLLSGRKNDAKKVFGFAAGIIALYIIAATLFPGLREGTLGNFFYVWFLVFMTSFTFAIML